MHSGMTIGSSILGLWAAEAAEASASIVVNYGAVQDMAYHLSVIFGITTCYIKSFFMSAAQQGAVLETHQEVAAATALERDRAARMAANKQRMHAIMGADGLNPDASKTAAVAGDGAGDLAVEAADAAAGGDAGTALQAVHGSTGRAMGEVAAHKAPCTSSKFVCATSLHKGGAGGSAPRHNINREGASNGSGGRDNSTGGGDGKGGRVANSSRTDAAATHAPVHTDGPAAVGDSKTADRATGGVPAKPQQHTDGGSHSDDSDTEMTNACGAAKPIAAAEVLAALVAGAGGDGAGRNKRKGGSLLLEEAIQGENICVL